MRYYFLQNKKLIDLLNINNCRNTLTLNCIALYVKPKKLLFNAISFVVLFRKQQILKSIFLFVVAFLKFQIHKIAASFCKYVNTFKIILFIRQKINISIQKIAFTAKNINPNLCFDQKQNNNLKCNFRKIAILLRNFTILLHKFTILLRKIAILHHKIAILHYKITILLHKFNILLNKIAILHGKIAIPVRKTDFTYRKTNIAIIADNILFRTDEILAVIFNILNAKIKKTLKTNTYNVQLIKLLHNK